MSDKEFSEFQKEISRFVQEKLKNKDLSDFFPKADEQKIDDKPMDDPSSESIIDFNLTPKELKLKLDEYIIKQDEAKKVLSVAVCDHYNHVKACLEDPSLSKDDYIKQNILMIGPTGVGKTHLIKTIADIINIPFVKADATKFSETGYVGGDVEDLIRDLIQKADGDLELAQYGIVYLDEIDKIATQSSGNKDVSGQGVQRGLLKLMEDTDVNTMSQLDMVSQFQSIMDMQSKGKQKKKTINTKHILFIMSGAFDGLIKIIKKKKDQKIIGFSSETIKAKESQELLHLATSHDFVEYGFESEFIGRLPVRVVCDTLDEGDLFQILKESKSSILNQYVRAFSSYDIDIRFTDDALRKIAMLASQEKTGARGLMTIFEQKLRDFKYELPGTKLKKIVITAEVLDHQLIEIDRLLHEKEYAKLSFGEYVINEYARECSERFGIEINFDDQAKKEIIQISQTKQLGVKAICDQLLVDLEYALNLLKGKNISIPLVITKPMLKDPDKELEKWVEKAIKD